MKIGITILKFIAVFAIIMSFGVGNAHEAGDITFLGFIWRLLFFWAIAGVSGYAVWRYDTEV